MAVVVGSALCALGCTSQQAPPPVTSALLVQDRAFREATDERLVVQIGELLIEVENPLETFPEAELIVKEAGGFVEHSTAEEKVVRLHCRVPAAQLEQVVDAVALLGREKNRQLSAADVTDEYFDLEARLKNLKALRGRLQDLLERAQSVSDVLAIEKELTRLQSEIEILQARFDSLAKKVELSSLAITIERRVVLGPVAYVGNGIGKLFAKLIIIR